MSTASIAVTLQNATPFKFFALSSSSAGDGATPAPSLILPGQSGSWSVWADFVAYVVIGCDGSAQFIINDNQGNYLQQINLKYAIPKFGSNDYSINVSGGTGTITASNGGYNTSVKFVVGFVNGEFTADVFPAGTAELGQATGGGLQVGDRRCVSVVSRSPDKLDVFRATAGGVAAAAWEPGDTAWRAWWPVAQSPEVPLGKATLAVSRAPDKLDVFIVGPANDVWTAAWEPSQEGWGGWWPVLGGIQVFDAESMAVVSRGLDRLDLFAADLDGQVWTAAWEPGMEGWGGWWPIGGVMDDRTEVAAVSRAADKLDVFAIGADGRVYGAAWQPGDEAWRGWWTVGELPAPAIHLSVVSRAEDKLDLFAVDSAGAVWTAAWTPADADWQGWWPIPGVQAAGRVAAVSRSTDRLDVFVMGADAEVYTAAWEPGEDGWRGWWQVGTGAQLVPNTDVAAVVRAPDKLDLFVVGADSRVYTAAWESGNTAWGGWWALPPE